MKRQPSKSAERFESASHDALWLVHLRWVAVVGQFVTIGIAAWPLGVTLRWFPLSIVVGLTAVSNLVLEFWLRGTARARRRRSTAILFSVMAADLVVLTALLYYTGGTDNPFAVFYLVNLALAAVVLSPRWAAAMGVIMAGCLVVLFFWHLPLADLQRVVLGESLTLRDAGLVVSAVTCAVVITYFMTRVMSELRLREAELRVAEQLRARSERLDALGTLAAGAAHELATPLSTIAVVVAELARELESLDVSQTVTTDMELMRGELDRCREILDQMSGAAGQMAAEGMVRATGTQLMEALRHELDGTEPVAYHISDGARQACMMLPLRSVAQAVGGVVRNALQAGGPAPVAVSFVADPQDLRVTIRDSGPGMTAEVLARVGQPFYTTKEPGKGMGLGLFLACTVLERLGGNLEIQSQPGAGTTASIRLPCV